MKNRVIFGMLAVAASAHAADVSLLTPVTYDPSASVVQKVKDECKLEERLTTDITDAFRRARIGGTVTSVGPGEVMKVRITHVLGVGGGGWSGPKAITVHADLMKDGKLDRTTRINRWSMGGVFGAFKGTCSILDRSSGAIAKDLVRWAKDPTYVVADEKPKDAPPEDDAASGPSTK
jgi:hypothetical protein